MNFRIAQVHSPTPLSGFTMDIITSGELLEHITKNFRGPKTDMGGGIHSIAIRDFVEYYEGSYYKISSDLGIGRPEAQELLKDCEQALKEEGYV